MIRNMAIDAYIITAALLPVPIFICFAQNVKSVANDKGGIVKSSIRDELNRERAKLNQLIEEAIEKGISPAESMEILEQSRKVDVIIAEVQKEKKPTRNRNEHLRE